jgi:hypothetical protein
LKYSNQIKLLKKTEGPIKNEQSRDTDTLWHKHRTKTNKAINNNISNKNFNQGNKSSFSKHFHIIYDPILFSLAITMITYNKRLNFQGQLRLNWSRSYGSLVFHLPMHSMRVFTKFVNEIPACSEVIFVGDIVFISP